jgi:ribosomal protein S8E
VIYLALHAHPQIRRHVYLVTHRYLQSRKNTLVGESASVNVLMASMKMVSSVKLVQQNVQPAMFLKTAHLVRQIQQVSLSSSIIVGVTTNVQTHSMLTHQASVKSAILIVKLAVEVQPTAQVASRIATSPYFLRPNV